MADTKALLSNTDTAPLKFQVSALHSLLQLCVDIAAQARVSRSLLSQKASAVVTPQAFQEAGKNDGVYEEHFL